MVRKGSATSGSSDIVVGVAGDTAHTPGIMTTGEMLTLACARIGYDIYTFQTNPAEIKGGQAWFQVRVADRELLSQGNYVHILLAFDQEGFESNEKLVQDGGLVLYDSDSYEPQPTRPLELVGVPMTRIAREEVRFPLAKNMVGLGAVAALLDVDLEVIRQMIQQKYGAKSQEIVEKNFGCVQLGHQYVREQLKRKPVIRLVAIGKPERLVLNGNEAISLGAIAAGCRFFAGYPITPASTILEFMLRELPKFGGTALQLEDEMAALAACIGASVAGVKAMTASSGPGLSLMVELLGLAAMTEVPVVIADIQRAGPSTGMPTKTEQSDLNMALYAGHGDVPRVVVACSSVRDAFFTTIRAFNLAEYTQGPCILLSDANLASRKATVTRPDLDSVTIVHRLMAPELPERGPGARTFARFQITMSGISPTAIPGMKGTYFVATGLEHDEYGAPNYTPEVHTAMTAKRYRKLDSAYANRNGDTWVAFHGDPEPEIGIISWGSTEGVIREAIQEAQRLGYKVGCAHTKVLSPFPERELRDFARKVRKVLVPEINFTGQFAQLIAAKLGVEPIRLTKVTGTPFTPQEILNGIKEAAS
jgi:2-oxoglutarate ferredoxin oxidoreductase subunit alpha